MLKTLRPGRLIARVALGLIAVPIVLVAVVYLSNWKTEHYFSAENRELNGRPAGVVLLGDSVTGGWRSQDQGRSLAAHPEIVNRGIGGDHIGVMILRMPNDVFALHPRTVVFLGGINDLKSRTTPDFLRFLAPLEVETGIRVIATLTAAHHERLILGSITPVDVPRTLKTLGIEPNKVKVEQILAVNAWMRDYARTHGLTYVDYYAAMTDGHDRMQPDLSGDGLHPNAAGYAVMGPLLLQALSSPDPATRDPRMPGR